MHVHYLISEYFCIWVVTARPPALYNELFHTLTDTHTILNPHPTSGKGWSRCLSLPGACEIRTQAGKSAEWGQFLFRENDSRMRQKVWVICVTQQTTGQ